MAAIQQIDRSSVHRLTSGQVVIDLQTAVKELLENSLDAGATSVEIRFKEHGVEAFEVQDNGKGIDQTDWDGIALKHHTSKLTTFSDLAQVSTLGFRGEALSSLCGTAELSLVTATALTTPAASSLTFETSGKCVVGGKAARSRGTTVTVKELFKHLPVRRKELIKNGKREFGKALELIQSYALLKTGCRIEVKNSVKGKWTTHLQTQASNSLRSNFSALFSSKSLPALMELDLVLDVVPDKSVLKWSDSGSVGSTQVLVKGLVSKPTTGSGRTSSNRQFYYVNGRPFNPAKVTKTFNDVYKTFNTGSFPTVVADLQLPPDAYDVNVSPDKRTIFLHSEANLLAVLKTALEELFQPSRSTYPMSQLNNSTTLTSSREISATNRPSPSPEVEAEEEEEEIERPAKRRRRSSSLDTSVPQTRANKKDQLAPNEMVSTSSPGGQTQKTSQIPDEADEENNDDIDIGMDTSFASSTNIAVDDSSTSTPAPSPQSSNKPNPPQPPAISRSPSPSATVSRSPSPTVTPAPIKLRQITLDTTLASWAPSPRPPQSTSKNQKTKSVKTSFKKKVKSLSKFMNPKQLVKMYIDDEAGVSGNYEEDDSQDEEEDGEDELEESENEKNVGSDDEEIEEGDEEEDDELQNGDGSEMGEEETGTLVVEDSSAEEDNDNDMNIIEDSYIASQGVALKSSSTCCSHSHQDAAGDKSDAISIDDEGEVDQEEQDHQEHLASLDSAGKTVPTEPESEISRAVLADGVTVTFDLALITSEWTRNTSCADEAASPQPPSAAKSGALAGASIDQDDAKAEATLARVVSKADFEAMRVVGQFNLGFIIARRTVAADDSGANAQDDLFIVDQHASDEKYNFEKLQRHTVIQSQRLIQPRSLNLPSHEEIIAIENVEILRLNGFDVLINEDADIGQRVKLIAQPVSKDTVFGVEDLEELLDLINSSSTGEFVRPSKARRMFASRACRKSVMVGDTLTKNQMTAVVSHMGGMEQPWSCPHGRPTMRWLAGLGSPSVDSREDMVQILYSMT